MNRPRRAMARKLASMNDPLNELSATSTPSPSVSRAISASNASSRESEDMMDAEGAKVGALGLASRGGEDFGAGPQRQMNRRKTDAARRGMDQHAIGTRQPGRLFERITRCQISDGEGRRFVGGEADGRRCASSCRAITWLAKQPEAIATTRSPSRTSRTPRRHAPPRQRTRRRAVPHLRDRARAR